MHSALVSDFIPGFQGHTSGPNGRVTRLVIHATVSPCVDGGARATAKYFQSSGAGGLAHYVVDPSEIIGCCDEDTSCWHAPPNAGSIGIELCDPQAGDPARWDDDKHTRMLALAAKLAADICARHNLPVQWLSPSQLLAGDSGITSHANVSAAWHKTDHTDPGPAFPVQKFLGLIAPFPGPGNVDPPPLEDHMQYVYVQKKGDGAVYAARHGSPPVHVDAGYDTTEYLFHQQGDSVSPSGDGKDIADRVGKTRKVLILASPEATGFFGL